MAKAVDETTNTAVVVPAVAPDFSTLTKSNRIGRTQKGQRIETRSAFFLRFYVTTTDATGASVRKQECVKLADKSDLYRSWADVEPLIAQLLSNVNQGTQAPTGQMSLDDFITKQYLVWAATTKAAATVNGYHRVWIRYLKPDLGTVALVNLRTVDVTSVLTKHAQAGKGSRTLSHMKWMLSGVYQYAIATGVIPSGSNPVEDAKWMHRVERNKKTRVYSLEEVMSMLCILEPVDLRATVAVALAYFAALRPAEIRGLKWEDYNGNELHVRRSIWRTVVGETKTEESEAAVFVIEPLRGLLEKLRKVTDGQGYILKNSSNQSLSLDSLNWRLIAPTIKKAGIEWRGFYPCRRGISSLVTGNGSALNATGLLRHSTPITALKHYTRAQKSAIVTAMRMVEEQAQVAGKLLADAPKALQAAGSEE
jgi:integrase